MNEMHGKVALITGAATGIGRAAAQLFAREGASLLLADLNEEQGEELAAQLRAGGSKAVFVKTDVAKAQDCERMVNAAVEHFGRLDAAFNNAGISDGPLPPGTIDYPLELWERIIAVNLSGVFYCMRYEIRAMLATGGGSIVNTSSVAGQIAFAGIPGYVAAKHGVAGLTKTVALEYGGKGIRCNTVAPGFIKTPMTQAVQENNYHQALTASIPAGRMAEAMEVAESALWLCSDRSSYVNGSFLAVDGGFLAQ